MTGSPLWRGGLFILVAVSLLVSEGRTQEPTFKPALVPGSADIIHNAGGIAIGMACQDALNIVNKTAYNHALSNGIRNGGGVARDGKYKNAVEYSGKLYEFFPRYGSSASYDVIDFKCLDDGGNREIFEVTRTIRFEGRGEIGPSVSTLRALFQEKYGVPSVEFSPTIFATMFNRKGLIEGKNKNCGPFQNNQLYLRDFDSIDPDQCSYALTFTANVLPEHPGNATWIKIVIRDYLRLQNAVLDIDRKNKERATVNVPKL